MTSNDLNVSHFSVSFIDVSGYPRFSRVMQDIILGG